ncbi:pro-resilin-like [Brienomyrus brachyistius]|uniref:pro-resilin-like n=1 Tax=Brienomyrus brachyistius TaxID=42636 RepID=UPI0020B3A9DC|nr:pro-resilin-like [Brienomyrus brachyistius]
MTATVGAGPSGEQAMERASAGAGTGGEQAMERASAGGGTGGEQAMERASAGGGTGGEQAMERASAGGGTGGEQAMERASAGAGTGGDQAKERASAGAGTGGDQAKERASAGAGTGGDQAMERASAGAGTGGDQAKERASAGAGTGGDQAMERASAGAGTGGDQAMERASAGAGTGGDQAMERASAGAGTGGDQAMERASAGAGTGGDQAMERASAGAGTGGDQAMERAAAGAVGHTCSLALGHSVPSLSITPGLAAALTPGGRPQRPRKATQTEAAHGETTGAIGRAWAMCGGRPRGHHRGHRTRMGHVRRPRTGTPQGPSDAHGPCAEAAHGDTTGTRRAWAMCGGRPRGHHRDQTRMGHVRRPPTGTPQGPSDAHGPCAEAAHGDTTGTRRAWAMRGGRPRGHHRDQTRMGHVRRPPTGTPQGPDAHGPCAEAAHGDTTGTRRAWAMCGGAHGDTTRAIGRAWAMCGGRPRGHHRDQTRMGHVRRPPTGTPQGPSDAHGPCAEAAHGDTTGTRRAWAMCGGRPRGHHRDHRTRMGHVRRPPTVTPQGPDAHGPCAEAAHGDTTGTRRAWAMCGGRPRGHHRDQTRMGHVRRPPTGTPQGPDAHGPCAEAAHGDTTGTIRRAWAMYGGRPQ